MMSLPQSKRRMQRVFRGTGKESVIYLLNNKDYPSVTEEIISEGTVNVICCSVCTISLLYMRDQQFLTSLWHKYCV